VLTDIDLKKYIAYELKYSLITYECNTLVADNVIIAFGSYIGSPGSYRPESIKLSGGEPKVASTIIQPGKMPRCEFIGFTAYLLKSNFKNTEGITITLKLEATPGAYQIEPHEKPVVYARDIKPSEARQENCRNEKTEEQFDLMHSQIAKKHAKKYEGLWAFETKGSGKEKGRVIILKSKADKTGGLEFSFIRTGNSNKAVFVKSSVDEHRVNAYFTFKGKPIMYSLVREGELLNGTVYSLKKEAKISLQKLSLSQAVDAIESDLSRIALLEEEVKKVRTEVEKQKSKFLVQTKEFQKHIGEFTKQAQALEEKNKKLGQQHRNLIEKNRKEAQEMRTKYEKLTAQLENAKKANRESEKQSNAKITLLRAVTSELRVKLKAAAQEIHELQAANEKLRQSNHAYKERVQEEFKAAFKKNRKLQTENEKLRQSNHAYKEQVQAEFKAAAKKNRKLQAENKKLRQINQALKEQNNKAGQPKEGSAQENEKPAEIGDSN
jgi:DNA repair exonuclease SbcCD ATPase subunit